MGCGCCCALARRGWRCTSGDVLVLRSRRCDVSLVRAAGASCACCWRSARRGLSVQLGGAWLVHELALSPWAPLSSWRFGIGARTGAEAYDEHRVDNVLLVAGSEHAARPVAVEVASNGQQFSSERGGAACTRRRRSVSAFFPERGPQTGSTVVRILGDNLGAGVALHVPVRRRGGGRELRRGQLDAALRVRASRATARAAPLEVSLNSQQYTAPGVSFTWYAPPTVRLVTPDRGPGGRATRRCGCSARAWTRGSTTTGVGSAPLSSLLRLRVAHFCAPLLCYLRVRHLAGWICQSP